METKRCYRCDKVKPIEMFRKESRRPDGHGYICRECKQKADKEYRERYDALHNIAKRVYRQAASPYPSHQPDARKAHNLVLRAIQRGDLPRVTERACAHCGKDATEYHHHNGYDPGYELDVIPLCHSCHKFAHGADLKKKRRH